MIRKHKQFERPKKQFDLQRIKSEDKIVQDYGLKNKKEIWKAKTKLDNFRSQAKKLIGVEDEKQKIFLEKLNKLGFNFANTTEVLSLKEEDILNRRLQTLVTKKGLANTQKEARQLITHKKIMINGEIINKPSYILSIEEEKNMQRVKDNQKKNKKEVKPIKNGESKE